MALAEECCIFFAREHWQANVEIGITKKPGRRFQMLLSAEVVGYDPHPIDQGPHRGVVAIWGAQAAGL